MYRPQTGRSEAAVLNGPRAEATRTVHTSDRAERIDEPGQQTEIAAQEGARRHVAPETTQANTQKFETSVSEEGAHHNGAPGGKDQGNTDVPGGKRQPGDSKQTDGTKE